MTDLTPGTPVLFMKVGVHAKEDLDSIITRKCGEIEKGGFAMWGYGGNTCHPLTIVRPFAAAHAAKPIKLVMEEINSNHFAEQIAADEYSVDGRNWQQIDKAIHRVLGSRYALFIGDLRKEEIDLDLSSCKVAVGPSEGRSGDAYVQGRVDKACLIVGAAAPGDGGGSSVIKQIRLVADLVSPYAALLRNV